MASEDSQGGQPSICQLPPCPKTDGENWWQVINKTIMVLFCFPLLDGKKTVYGYKKMIFKKQVYSTM